MPENNSPPSNISEDDFTNRVGSVSAEMPKYVCHKEVHALKIESLYESGHGHTMMVPADEGFGTIRLDENYVEKHAPQAGGYYVVYEDGYKSYSPAKAFESGYTAV